MNKMKINVKPSLWIALSLALIFIPVSWLFSWVVAAAVHEIFHLLALHICRFSVNSLNISASGAGIEADMEPGLKMVICALAGPLSGLFLLIFVHSFPRIAICGLLQSLCNLLPVYPLDGSRIITGISFALFQEKTAVKICSYTERVIIIAAGAVLVYSAIRFELGIIPIVTVIIMFIKKYLANPTRWRYNRDNRD